jgi:DNA-binding NarL/FixJ family response regulator
MTGTPPYHLLLIDDDELFLKTYTAAAKRDARIALETAPSAAAALGKLRGGLAPQLILLDIEMPAMNGFQLLEKMRAEKLAESALVVILSNKGNADYRARAREFSVSQYILKASMTPSEVFDEAVYALEQAAQPHNTLLQ